MKTEAIGTTKPSMTPTGSLLAGRYRLNRRIATGGMGVVWAATDKVLGRPVAIKVVKPEYADDPAFRSRLQDEARAAASVHDPRVVSIYDVGEVEDAGRCESFIVMELVAGHSLAQELADGPLPPQRVAALIADVAAALAAAHARRVVHRDIKPANLMCDPAGRFVVLDFGIARAASASSLTATGVVLGTARYLSPEQAAGKPARAASDVYSLGVVAHQCLAGSPPFDAESDVAIALAHLHDPVPPLPASVPQPLAELVTRCLAKKPSDRPTAAELSVAARSLPLLPEQPAPATTRRKRTGAIRIGALGAAGGATEILDRDAAAVPDQRSTPAWLTSRWIAAGAVGGLALIGVITALAMAASSPDRSGSTDSAHRAVVHSAPASPVAVDKVRVVPRRFVGKTYANAAIKLSADGLRPEWRLAVGGGRPGRVVAVAPAGLVPKGAAIKVYVAMPVPHVAKAAPHHAAPPHGPGPAEHGHGPGPKPEHGHGPKH